MKVADYFAQILLENNINTIHCVTGGAVVHLLDSCERYGIKCIYYQHEQSAGFGAIAESKVLGSPSVCIVTTGPGGTNTITPLLGAWQDSLPVLFVSGQARLEHLSRNNSVRQLGTQEFDIVNLVKPITKEAIILEDIDHIEKKISDLLQETTNDRPGPVWLDFPLDFQWQDIQRPKNISNNSSQINFDSICNSNSFSSDELYLFLKEFTQSERPAVIIGGGVRFRFKKTLIDYLENNSVPYTVTYTSISNSQCNANKFNFGVPGIAGNRIANSVLFNSSDLLCIGTHLPVPITGSNHQSWCSQSNKYLVNIDNNEIKSHRVNFEKNFNISCEYFIEKLIEFKFKPSPVWNDFLNLIRKVKEPRNIPPSPYIDLYSFIDKISKIANENILITVDGGGTINSAFFSNFKPQFSTTITMASSICAMGSGIPELIGSWSATRTNKNARYILLVGDGSFTFNIQDLATIKYLGINCHIFVICNSGYSSIRNTLDSFLEGRHYGVSEQSGVFLPEVKSYASTYGFKYNLLNFDNFQRKNLIEEIIFNNEQSISEVIVNPNQVISPTQGFRKQKDGKFLATPLYQMNPELSPEIEAILSTFMN